MSLDTALPLEQQIEETIRLVGLQKIEEDDLRRETPLIRYLDAEGKLQHVGGTEVRMPLSWVSNDTGPAQVEFPADSHVALWIRDEQGRIARGEGKSVILVVDYCGARWNGTLDKFWVEQREDGDTVLIADFLHDYEHLKWLLCWSNPFTNESFQPGPWSIAGPVDWVLKVTALANMAREHNPAFTWPDEPLDPEAWDWLDQRQWHMAVHPGTFLESMDSGIVWGVVVSKFSAWHDLAHPMLEDAELSVQMRRYMEGDPDPWPGYKPRHGQLIMNIVDKSGVYVGTSHGGTIFDGLVRTAVEFADDFIDSTITVLEDAPVPADYFLPGNRYTAKEMPYVVFREGETSPIQTSKFVTSPAKGVQIVCGGHSMPGVNETISATIQAVGDLIGNVVMVGSLGGTLDTLLKPMYEDRILAWQKAYSRQRSVNAGWERLFEYFQQGASNAYTVSSLMVLRAGLWATKSTVSWTAEVIDGTPWLVGDSGLGHFFQDDRVGLVLEADPTGAVHMDRCRRLDLIISEDEPPEWKISIGDERVLQDPFSRAAGRIERLITGLRDQGVW